MIFITTFNKPIYQICGNELLTSFVMSKNATAHKLVVFFENDDDLYTENYPEWLVRWSEYENIILVNLMNYEYKNDKIIATLDSELASKFTNIHEYDNVRSLKWFRPVASIKYASELFDAPFCSIDADCKFTNFIDEPFFIELFTNTNIAFLGRESFKVMRHGAYNSEGEYIMTTSAPATDADTHTETGFIGFNTNQPGTLDFINRNFNYWVSHDVLKLKYKTDCHTFDAVRSELKLNYKNLCAVMGEISPIGSRVIEDSILGTFLTHNKGTIGPILFYHNLI